MEMCKFIIELHPDGNVSWNEYEEPVRVSNVSDAKAVKAGYIQAINDVITIIKLELARCNALSKMKKYGTGWETSWMGRCIECEVLISSINKLKS